MRIDNLYAKVENREIVQFPIYGNHLAAKDANVYPVHISSERPEDTRETGHKLDLNVIFSEEDGSTPESVTGSWVSYPRTDKEIAQWDEAKEEELRILKRSLMDQVNKLRYDMLDMGITVNDIEFQTGPQDRENIAGAVQLAVLAQLNEQPFSIDWIAKDNTVHTLDSNFIFELGEALANRKAELIFRSRQVKEDIQAASSEEELPNITSAMADQ